MSERMTVEEARRVYDDAWSGAYYRNRDPEFRWLRQAILEEHQEKVEALVKALERTAEAARLLEAAALEYQLAVAQGRNSEVMQAAGHVLDSARESSGTARFMARAALQPFLPVSTDVTPSSGNVFSFDVGEPRD